MFKLLAIISVIAVVYAAPAPGVVVTPVVHHAPLVPVGHHAVSHSIIHPAPVVRTIVPVKTIVPVVKPVVALHPVVPVVKTIVPVHHPAVLVHH